MRGYVWQKHAFHFFRTIRRPHQTRNHTKYCIAAVSTAAAVVYSRHIDRTRTKKKKVTPLESSHRNHRPARAASARAARERCFDPTRAATTPGCRACSASREHRVGSLWGRIKLRLTATAVVRVYSSCQPELVDKLLVVAPDDGSHPQHRPSPMPQSSWARAGCVWACTRPLQSVYAAAELVCRT